jgi:uncharacterized membrane protein YbhN (UPF0104 family)
VRWLLGLALLTACAVFVLRGIDPSLLGQAWRTAEPTSVALACLLLLLGYCLRGVRWHYLFPEEIRREGLHHSLGILFVGFLFNDVLPARAGELVRVALMKRHHQVPASGTLATLFAERVLDGFVLGVLGLAAFRGVLPGELPWLALLAAGFAGLFAVILGLGHFQQRVSCWLSAWAARSPGRIPAFMCSAGVPALRYLSTLATGKALLRALLLTLAVWGLEGVVYLLVAQAFGAQLPAETLGALLSATNFASLAPTPGGLGTIEVAGIAVLGLKGMAKEPALLIVGVQHLLHYLVALSVGGWFVLRLMPGGERAAGKARNVC